MKIPKLKTDLIQNIVIGALALLLLLSNFSVVARLLGKLNPLGPYQRQIDELKERVLSLEFDRVRIEDVSNLLLALQDFSFDTGAFPATLGELKEGGYLGENRRLIDPGTNQPYFYQNRGNGFVLCVWLSDMVKGVNTSECPSESNDIEATEVKIEITGDSMVNIRESAIIDSLIMARAQPGETYISFEERDGWYHIVVNGEKSGWVHGDFVRLISGN